MADRRVILFDDDRMLRHAPDADSAFLSSRLERRVRQTLANLEVKWKYPEHPGRITAVRDYLRQHPVPGVLTEPGASASLEQLGRVHTRAYLESILELHGKNAWLDVDTTAVSPGSVEAARVAAGTAIAAATAVVEGRADAGFALVRPPGHHAEPVRARGFCLFNNVAVAAAHAQAKLGCERVLIIDWDAHHGNGTQSIFWANPDVLFFDVHCAAPFYPGSGLLNEVGAGLAEGTTVNVPIPVGSGDVALVRAFRDVLVPAADWFQPDLVLVSAGFDPHRLDLALNATTAGFAALTGVVRDIVDRHCPGRLAMVLEGGYHTESLASGVHAVLDVLAGADAPEVREPGVAAVEEAAAFHRNAFVE